MYCCLGGVRGIKQTIYAYQVAESRDVMPGVVAGLVAVASYAVGVENFCMFNVSKKSAHI